MTDSAILFLSIVGGYAFSLNFKVTNLSVLKSHGYALFFRAVLWGYVFFHAACLILLIGRSDPGWSSFFSFWLHPADTDVLAAVRAAFVDSIRFYKNDLAPPSILALWIGLFLAWPLNLVFRSKALHARIATKACSEMEAVLASSLGNRQMLLITLDSSKVYAGWVIRTPRVDASNQDPGSGFEILAYQSGYRDPVSQTVNFTTDYSWLLDEPNAKSGNTLPSPNAVSTFIPLSRVVAITNFDRDLYPRFHEECDYSPRKKEGSQSGRATKPDFRRHLGRRM